MNFYFMHGPSVPEVVREYSRLPGKPELPPLWALGFHQCKWSYKSEIEVMGIADGFKKRGIPCDAIYVDIDYMDGFRCFTWNRDDDGYPNPSRMTKRLEKEGIKMVRSWAQQGTIRDPRWIDRRGNQNGSKEGPIGTHQRSKRDRRGNKDGSIVDPTWALLRSKTGRRRNTWDYEMGSTGTHHRSKMDRSRKPDVSNMGPT